MGFKVFVTTTEDKHENKKYQKIIKLKRNRLSEHFMQYLRANLIFTFQKNSPNVKDIPLLISAPVQLDFEIQVLSTGIKVLSSMFGTPERKGMYKTTLEEDLEIINQGNLSWRKYLAVLHRVTQKEVLQQQIRLFNVLLEIILRIKQFQNNMKVKS